MPVGFAADLRIATAAALLTFASGLIMLIGFLMAGGFGAFIGLIGAGFGWMWWAEQHGGKVFPRDLPNRSLVLLGCASVGLGLLMLALS